MKNNLLYLTLTLLCLLNPLSLKGSSLKKPKQIQVMIYKGSAKSLNKDVLQVKLSDNQVNFEGKGLSFKSNRSYFRTKNKVTIKGKNYTGDFKILKQNKNFLIINKLLIEDYLCGVLIGEISPTWPDAAIQAQAVAARSYAYHLMEKNKDKPYHLVSTTQAQVFYGSYHINENFKKNIAKTKNKILTAKNKPIISFFHATCGGLTARVNEVWSQNKKPPPYFQNIRCHYCTTHPNYHWKVSISKQTLSSKLQKYLPVPSDLKHIRISKYSRSKRAQTVDLILKSSKKITLKGNEFRLQAGPKEIKSLFFSIQKQGEHFIFKGKGYGHGVGLCQWGAKTMAEKGYNARGILKFYYKRAIFKEI